MADYDLYGIDVATLNDAVMIVTALLKLPFYQHESSYVGDYFLADGEGGETFKVRENIDPDDGEPAETDYASHEFLLYVDGSDRGSDLRQMLQSDQSVKLLRHECL